MAPPTSSADKWGAAEGVAELRLRRGEREERIGPHFGGEGGFDFRDLLRRRVRAW